MTATTAERIARFWGKVQKSDGCWEWIACRGSGKHRDGYGKFYVGRRRIEKAHRFSWELHVGPIPDGLKVLHTCDNPPCVRPDHLFLGTTQDNARDMAAKHRAPTQQHPECYAAFSFAKLTPDAVKSIRRERTSGTSAKELGRRFGVHFGTINAVMSRRTWGWVE